MTLQATQVVRASENFWLDQHHLPGFPLVLDRNGYLIEPVFDFLRTEAVQRHMAPGTVLDEAYILRAWWNSIASGQSVSAIDADTIVRWTGQELARLSRGQGRSKRRLKRCLEVIGRFHRHVLCERNSIAGPEGWRASNYLARLDPRLRDRSYADVSFGSVPSRLNGGRPTPSEPEVERVLEVLADRPNSYLAARNWLIARWMREVGLRRAGVASLTIESIQAALTSEGIIARGEDLSRAGTTLQTRSVVRQAIRTFELSGRTFVGGQITEKGGKTRDTQIPVGLMLETLDYVWAERATVQRAGPLRGSLWLSLKTRRALTAAAIGDIVKAGFRTASVEGSGHRLRACFAEDVVFRLYEEARVSRDVLFDENQVLLDAAEIMGHTSWKSLRSYLNRAARNYAAGARSRGR